MRCDCCHLNDFNEVLILRDKKFTKKGKFANKNKYHRVCLRCAKQLAKKEFYEFGKYWTSILIHQGEGIW